MLVTTAMVGESIMKDPSLSSDSATSMSPWPSFALDPPQMSSLPPNQQAQQDPDNIILEIDPGSYKVNTKPLTREQLGPFLTQTYTGRPKKVIFVKADGQVTYQTVIEAMDEERFLILPHPEVKEYMARKLDRDRWLRGMRRLRDKSGEGQSRRA